MAPIWSPLRRILNRSRRILVSLGLKPSDLPVAIAAKPFELPDSAEKAAADWKHYALELEASLESGSAPRATPVIRMEIALPSAEPAADERLAWRFRVPGGSRTGPLVTVIVPVYDEAELTVTCLQSLAKHPPLKARAEYVVVDDASPTDVAAALAGIQGVTLVRNGENLGFLRTCNRAARLSQADYLVFLNNDTEVQFGWLDALVETAERDRRVGVVGSKLIYPDGTLQEAGGLIWRDASGWNYGRGARPDDPAYEFARDVDYCSGAALLVRRSLFEALGGFDERYAPAYYEDVDLCFAARRAGSRVVYQPRSVVVHVEGASSGTDVRAGVKRHQALNQPKFCDKWRDVLEVEHAAPDPDAVPRCVRRLQGSRTLLMIDSYVPEPDRDAGSNRIAHVIRMLRELDWHVIFLPDNYHGSQPYTDDLQQLGVEVLYHVDGGLPADARLREAFAHADMLWIARPDVFAKYRQYVELRPDLPALYDTVDLHHVRHSREIELLGAVATDEARRLQRDLKVLELDICRTVDVVVTVTEIEKRALEAEGLDNVHVIPTVHVPRARKRTFEDTEGIIFIGGYNHTPNVDAAEWLVRDIMPLVWEDFPTLKVTLLGSNPRASIRELARDSRVTVTGYVTDVAPYFESARVFVAPLRFGAGMKGKIGQSLEFELPVVTTSIGAEGFDFLSGRDALIADDAETIAAALKRLYCDRMLWATLSSASSARIAPLVPARVKQKVADALADAKRRHLRRAAEVERA